MTDLKTRITDDVKTAMKAGEKDRVALLRMLTAEMKQREVVEQIVLTDAVVISAIEKMIKQRKDSASQFDGANRPELATKERAEIVLLQTYLPAQLSAEEISALIAAAIAQTGASSAKDLGKVVGVLKPQVAGKAEMSAVTVLIKAALGG